MPFEYQIDPGHRLIAVSFTGPVSLADLGEAGAAVLSDASYGPGLSLLVVLLDADLGGLPTDVVRQITGSPPPFPRLAIAAPAGYAFGLARMYQLTMSASSVAVFPDRAAALEWIGGTNA